MSVGRRFRLGVLGCAAAMALAACNDTGKTVLPGERLSVLSLDRALEPDPEAAALAVRLPAPQPNREWPQAGGYPGHAMHHLLVGERLGLAWEADIGAAADASAPIINGPVSGAGRVFTVDAEGEVSAFEAASGRSLWSVELGQDDTFPGGLAFAEGRVFVTTGYGAVVALDAESGAVLWNERVGEPLRAPPTVAGGRVFALTYANRLVALSAAEGELLWSYEGLAESADFIGNAAPAADENTVIAALSSGDLVALSAESGRVLWGDTLSRERRTGGIGTLSGIQGEPVIDRGLVLAASHAGNLAAIDLRTGQRLWQQDISSLEMPWVAGDFVYVLTVDGQIVCLTRAEGRVRWVTQLPRWEDPEVREDAIFWAGPVLAGDRLIVTGSSGVVLSVSPYTGAFLGGIDLGESVRLAPIVADGTVYILTEGAELLALR